MTAQTKNRSIILGVVFILMGVIFLLENLNILYFDFFDYFFNWKGILLIVGGVIILSNENKVPGYIMAGIAGFFILGDIFRYEFGMYWFSLHNFFWPVIIIGIGVLILTRRDKPSFVTRFGERTDTSDPEAKDYINQTAILGGGDVKFKTDNFRGGKVTAFMGGGNYDLSTCQLAEGSQEIDVFAMFGGVGFIVPSDWNVRIEVTSIFGGFTDSRKANQLSEATDPTRELVIRGTVLFGGGDIKNFV